MRRRPSRRSSTRPAARRTLRCCETAALAFLKKICDDLGVPRRKVGIDQQAELTKFLLEQADAGKTVVIFVDGKRQFEALGKLHHAFTAGGEAVEELAARGVGDCTEDVRVCAG